MEKRHSSPSPMALSPRSDTPKKRSNSVPIVEALGCSTQEAELILAESRAVVRCRQSKRGRRNRQENNDESIYRPRDHIKYLQIDPAAQKASSNETRKSFQPLHSRAPSNLTDGSTSTVTGSAQLSPDESQSPSLSPRSPLGDYSANLTKFIQSQLNSIPTYRSTHPMVYPRSCPDLKRAKSPLRSPIQIAKRPIEMPQILELPGIRPPLRSAFSAWSSTDDGTDDADDADDDEIPPLPDIHPSRNDSDLKSSADTPSILRYYSNSSSGSFLLSSTPLEDEIQEPDTAKADTFPYIPAPVASQPHEDDHFSSAPSTHDRLYSSSAPSFSSSSTASYFDYNRPITLAPYIKDRIIAAVSSRPDSDRIITAISPFEGGDLANVHDILVESQKRVVVEGLSFDLVRDWQVPEEVARVPTPC